MTQVVRPLLADAKLSLLAVVNPLADVQNQPVAVKHPLVDATTVAGVQSPFVVAKHLLAATLAAAATLADVLTSQLAGVKHPLVVAQ